MHTREDTLTAVNAALAREPCLDLQRYPVHLTIRDDILTLEGEVEHIAAKKLTLERAAAVPGVEGIIDRLRVAPSVPMSDDAIRAHVRDALYQEPALATFALNVGDQEGVEPVRPATGSRSALLRWSSRAAW
jgi:hypothetical protein